jgi:thiamine-monophosphate kinase
MHPFRSEAEFTRWLAKKSAGKRRGLRLGIGDDAALFEGPPGFEWVVTADLSVEGIHFSMATHPPDSVGHRALARSLSDVAAMGGKPRFALVSLATSRRISSRWIEAFLKGVLRLAGRYHVTLIGGDTTLNAGKIAVDMTVLGEVRRDRALLRSGARPGHHIFVGGKLGYSALGLQLLRSGSHRKSAPAREALRAHLYPKPQCQLGTFLAERRIASAAIDISDGLSTDLNRLAEASKTGARIWGDRIPGPGIDSSVPSPLALHGGEDYKLLFTVAPAHTNLVPDRFDGAVIYRIGEIQDRRSGVEIVNNGRSMRLKPEGYDHFQIGLKTERAKAVRLLKTNK